MDKLYWAVWWWVRHNIIPDRWKWAVEMDEPGCWRCFTATSRWRAIRRGQKIRGLMAHVVQGDGY